MEELKFPNKRTSPKSAGASVAAAGKVASVAEGRRKPGSDPIDKQHAKDMARINKLNESRNR